jgi:hypothetical protein
MQNLILSLLKLYSDNVPCNYVIRILLLKACYQTCANVVVDTELKIKKNREIKFKLRLDMFTPGEIYPNDIYYFSYWSVKKLYIHYKAVKHLESKSYNVYRISAGRNS